MASNLLNAVIRRIGNRLVWLAVVLVLAGISAGAKMILSPKSPKVVDIPEAKTASAPKHVMPRTVTNANAGTVANAHPVSATAKGTAITVPGAKGIANPSKNVAANPANPSNPAVATPNAALVYGPPAPPAMQAPASAPVKAPATAAAQTSTTPAGLQAAAASAMPPAVTSRPVATAHTAGAKPGPAIAPSHLDEQLTYQYETVGRRDPFAPLVGGNFVGSDVGGDAPVDVGGMKVVGVVWGDNDKFAMVEDARGQSNVLRVGDRVQNGVVTGLKKDGVIVALTVDGQSQTVTIPLTKKGDQSNANR